MNPEGSAPSEEAIHRVRHDLSTGIVELLIRGGIGRRSDFDERGLVEAPRKSTELREPMWIALKGPPKNEKIKESVL